MIAIYFVTGRWEAFSVAAVQENVLVSQANSFIQEIQSGGFSRARTSGRSTAATWRVAEGRDCGWVGSRKVSERWWNLAGMNGHYGLCTPPVGHVGLILHKLNVK